MHTTEPGVPAVVTWIQKARSILLLLYTGVLFIVLPLTMKDGYSGLGRHKYKVFSRTSVVFLALLLLAALAQKLMEYRTAGGTAQGKPGTERERRLVRRVEAEWNKMMITDRFVLLYLILAFVSFAGARDHEDAFRGAGGWYMGLLSQILFAAVYYVVSRTWKGERAVWYVMAAGSFAVFLLGILHRFSIDPLGVYVDMGPDQKLQFLSTLGQATWYSSFVCTVFPLGLFWFFHSDSVKVRTAAGIFSAAGFATLATQNSDSAFASLALVLVLLFYLAFDGKKEMGRFLETVLLMLFTFQAVGLLQSVFDRHAVRLGAFSEFVTQSVLTGALLVIFCGIYAWYSIKGFSFLENGKDTGRRLRRIGITAFAAAAALLVFIIAANTAGSLGGILPEKLQTGGYLYFNERWGSGRGKTWMFAASAFAELPWPRKLFGVGPDCFSSYFYGISRYASQLYEMWGNDTLTNAHNEWMNAVLCYGLAGGAAYIGIFVSGIVSFFKKRFSSPQAVAAALCLMAYMGHNLFCYQQVLCTPYVFWILGMGAVMIRKDRIK